MPYTQDVNAFAMACNTLLSDETPVVAIARSQHEIIQFYLSAMTVKFPALLG